MGGAGGGRSYGCFAMGTSCPAWCAVSWCLSEGTFRLARTPTPGNGKKEAPEGFNIYCTRRSRSPRTQIDRRNGEHDGLPAFRVLLWPPWPAPIQVPTHALPYGIVEEVRPDGAYICTTDDGVTAIITASVDAEGSSSQAFEDWVHLAQPSETTCKQRQGTTEGGFLSTAARALPTTEVGTDGRTVAVGTPANEHSSRALTVHTLSAAARVVTILEFPGGEASADCAAAAATQQSSNSIARQNTAVVKARGLEFGGGYARHDEKKVLPRALITLNRTNSLDMEVVTENGNTVVTPLSSCSSSNMTTSTKSTMNTSTDRHADFTFNLHPSPELS
ncbi:hypothetical protein DFH27DRAFT_645463 [Peziza echinospora]|nr:hypothetical protein DFH27DRAFT_645463 [Peziza echinospora]